MKKLIADAFKRTMALFDEGKFTKEDLEFMEKFLAVALKKTHAVMRRAGVERKHEVKDL